MQSFDDTISIEPLVFRSDKVVLEPVNISGLDDFHEYSMHPELYTYLEFSPFTTISETKAYLKKLIERSTSSLAQYWFIRAVEHDKIIGTFGIHSLEIFRKSAEIGYGISPYYWGNGYFSESLKLILEYIFNNLKLHRVVARTSILNKPSILGLEKFGFLKEGIMRDYYRGVDGQRYDAVLMALLSK